MTLTDPEETICILIVLERDVKEVEISTTYPYNKPLDRSNTLSRGYDLVRQLLQHHLLKASGLINLIFLPKKNKNQQDCSYNQTDHVCGYP